jgi:glycerophosphoryl diester phosphodiesterase
MSSTTLSSPFPCSTTKDKLKTAFIPDLEEVLLDAKKTGLFIKIELKGWNTELPALELVEKLGMEDQCSFASFYHDRIHKIRKARPERKADGTHRIQTGALFNNDVPHDFINIVKNVGASEVHLRYDTFSKERVDEIHNAGLRSMSWFRGFASMAVDSRLYHDVGNEDERMYSTLLKTGVMILCINRPQHLVKLLNRTTATTTQQSPEFSVVAQ